jgi:hypothetical protein
VVGKCLEIVFDLVAFVTVVRHEGVYVDNEVLLGAILYVVVMQRLQVCMLVPVTLQEGLFVMSAPDLMKGAARTDNMSTRNPHGGRGDAQTVPKIGRSA